MSMTVIFSNAGDEDCQTLRNLWHDIDDVKVIELTPDNCDSKRDEVSKAVESEEDFLLLCGHGSPWGLMNPNFHGYAFNVIDLLELKAKQVVSIWCYANEFWVKWPQFKIPALTSSMYISNPIEAEMNGITGTDQKYVNRTNEATFNEMNRFIRNGVPINEWPRRLMDTLDRSNPIDSFNRGGMMYLGYTPEGEMYMED